MTPSEKDEEKTRRTTLRVPEWLYNAVATKADENRRSLNQEIMSALEAHIMPEDVDLANASRNQLLGFHVGAMVYASIDPPHVEGFTKEQVSEVIEGLVAHFRSYLRPDPPFPREFPDGDDPIS